MAKALEGRKVLWNTDSKNVVGILQKGSMNKELHSVASDIHSVLNKYSIVLLPEWIPRNMNVMADKLSREAYKDSDDWRVSQAKYDEFSAKWVECTVDRFATSYNTKCYRFNSRIWLAGCQAVDCMSQNWANDVNWVVPPPKMVGAVLKKIENDKATSILIVPAWTSAPYWPMLRLHENISIADQEFFLKKGNILPGFGNNGVFSDDSVNFLMLACFFKF